MRFSRHIVSFACVTGFKQVLQVLTTIIGHIMSYLSADLDPDVHQASGGFIIQVLL